MSYSIVGAFSVIVKISQIHCIDTVSLGTVVSTTSAGREGETSGCGVHMNCWVSNPLVRVEVGGAELPNL